MSSRVVLTGAGGFIGSKMLQYLLAEGHKCFTLGAKKTSDNHILLDLANTEDISRAISEISPEYFLHLAGANPNESLSTLQRVNCLYASSIIEGIKKSTSRDTALLLIGSAAEYDLSGNCENIPENHNCSPRNAYGLSKYFQTQLGLFEHSEGLKILVVRPFGIVGPGMPQHLFLQNLALQFSKILKGENCQTIKVGNVNVERDFLDVELAVKLLWSLVTNNQSLGQIVNLCSGEPVPLTFLINTLEQLSGIKPTYIVDESRLRKNEPKVLYGSVSKLSVLTQIPLRPINETTIEKILAHIIGIPTTNEDCVQATAIT